MRISAAAFLASTSLTATTSSSHAFLHNISGNYSSLQWVSTVSRFNNHQKKAECSALHQSSSSSRDSSTSTSPERVTLESMVESLKEGKYKKILVVSGAGVSVSAGIPE